jgi:hypothetical protein
MPLLNVRSVNSRAARSCTIPAFATPILPPWPREAGIFCLDQEAALNHSPMQDIARSHVYLILILFRKEKNPHCVTAINGSMLQYATARKCLGPKNSLTPTPSLQQTINEGATPTWTISDHHIITLPTFVYTRLSLHPCSSN